MPKIRQSSTKFQSFLSHTGTNRWVTLPLTPSLKFTAAPPSRPGGVKEQGGLVPIEKNGNANLAGKKGECDKKVG